MTKKCAPYFLVLPGPHTTSRAWDARQWPLQFQDAATGYSWSRKIIAVLVSLRRAAFGAQLMSKLAADDQDTLGILHFAIGHDGEKGAAA